MKMIIIAYNMALEEEVMEVLDSAGLDCYTKWEKVTGRGRLSAPHLGTHVWPGFNNVMMVIADDGSVSPLLEGVRNLRRTLGKEGIKAFVLPVEDVTP